jgi:hypothetical protein
MPGTEWPRTLLSPQGVLLYIRDLDALKRLCALNKDIDMRAGNMKALLGIDTGSSARQQYKYGYQDFPCVRWLTHPGLDHCIPVVQQPAAFFDTFKLRADAADITAADKDTFIAFVNGNLRRSIGRKKEKVALVDGRFGAAEWRVVLRPDGAEHMVPRPPAGSSFAMPQVRPSWVVVWWCALAMSWPRSRSRAVWRQLGVLCSSWACLARRWRRLELQGVGWAARIRRTR